MDGWLVLDTMILFTAYGDSVAGSCQLILAVHSNTEEGCKPTKLKTTPLLAPWPITQHLWAPFNKPELTVSYSKDDSSFNSHALNDVGLLPLKVTIPSDAQRTSVDPSNNIMYHFHRNDDNPTNLVGSAVVGVDGICPAFLPIANTNIFGHYFGIEFCHDGHSYVCGILLFGFVLCFYLSDKIT
jgi:hypothetical protein